MFGNDLATLPDFPAEIRAPAGTLAGVSAFQVHIADHDILTPGDAPNVLVAMNPAALKANVADLVPPGGDLIVNTDAFDERTLDKAGYSTNPLARRLPGRLHRLRGADDLAHPGGVRADRASSPATPSARKNLFALGLLSLALQPARPSPTLDWIVEPLRQDPPGRRGQHAGLQGRLQLRRDGRALRVATTRSAGRPSWPRRPTATSPATRRWPGA